MASLMLQLLSKEEQDRIHAAALELLEGVGLKIMNAEALEVLADAGASVDPQSQQVRFPPHLIEQALEAAPKEIKLYHRDPSQFVHLCPGNVYYTTNGYAVQIYDPGEGTRRIVRQEDLAWITRLADGLDQVDIISVLATPTDAPPQTNDRYQLAISLLNSTKHIWATAYGPDGLQDALDMAAAVRGSRAALRTYPLFTLDMTTLSPLTLDDRQASTMVAGAREDLPIGISPGPIAGATSPVTLAGTITQANAEVLGAITLVQCVQPGTPVIFTQYTRALDMATGSLAMGGPEFGLLRVATAEMARYYGLPSRGGAMITDAKAADAQMGAEKTLGCVLASLAGLNIVAGVGAADFINTLRPDMMLIENEIISAARWLLKEIAVTDQTIAAELIREIGPGGNYLAHDHTAEHFRRELWFPKLWDRQPWVNWEAAGAQTVSDRAWQVIQEMDVRVPPLESRVEKAIWDIVHEADHRFAGGESSVA